MALDGKTIQKVQEALLRAFSPDELTRLVRIYLDENLDAITSGENFSQTVFDLIIWAERHERLDDLVTAWYQERPEYVKLARVLGWDVDSSGIPKPPTQIADEEDDAQTVPQPDADPNRKLKVFLCHASEDKETVRQLYHQLKADGMDPWLDEVNLRPGQEWQREIPRAVRDADVVLVCLSNASIDKDGFVKREIQFAVDAVNKNPDVEGYLIPLRFEDCSVPDSLIRWQWVDLFNEGGYARLIESMRYRASALGLQSTIAANGSSSFVTKPTSKRKIPWVVIGGIIAAVAGIAGIMNDGFGVWDRLRLEATVSPTEIVIAANDPIETSISTEAEKSTTAPIDPTATPASEPTATDLPKPTATPVPPTNTPAPPTATPEPQAGDIRDVNDITFVYVPAGSFTMGSNDGFDNEKPPHTVNVDAFWMMQTEVTKAEYKRCMENGPCTAPNDRRISDPAFANHPVVRIDWYQATAYAEWIDGRLPTEAEWEYACRGTDGRTYPWGNDEPSETRLNYLSNVGDTTEVGSYPIGANGLYDMAGNVWEWTSSRSEAYPYESDDGREEQDGTEWRTLRGGSFDSNDSGVRCATRTHFEPEYGWNHFGFRIVLVESPDFLSSESPGH